MTVSTEVNQAAYTGNGVTTVFPYTFRILNSNNLTVTRIDLLEVETVLTLGTDYTVSGAGSYNGGSVVLTQALPSGYSLVIERDLAAVQETDLRNQGTFFAEVHEDVFDYLTMLVQQVTSWLGLALRRPTVKSKFYDSKQYRIANLADPANAQDAVNNRSMRNYVDQMIAGVVGGFGWFIQAGAGAYYRTFQDKMRDSVSIKDFGAVSGGDVTNAILNALLSTSGTVVVPPGDYVSSPNLSQIQSVLSLLSRADFQGNLIINIPGGISVFTQPVVVECTNGEKLSIIGTDSIPISITGQSSVSGVAGNYSVSLTVSGAMDNISVGDYLHTNQVTGTGACDIHRGAWKVTSIGPGVVTVKNTCWLSAFPANTITASLSRVIKSVLRFEGCDGIVVPSSIIGNLSNIVLEGNSDDYWSSSNVAGTEKGTHGIAVGSNTISANGKVDNVNPQGMTGGSVSCGQYVGINGFDQQGIITELGGNLWGDFVCSCNNKRRGFYASTASGIRAKQISANGNFLDGVISDLGGSVYSSSSSCALGNGSNGISSTQNGVIAWDTGKASYNRLNGANIVAGGFIQITNGFMQGNVATGANLAYSAVLYCDGSQITGNGTYGIYCQLSSKVRGPNCTFTGNVNYGLRGSHLSTCVFSSSSFSGNIAGDFIFTEGALGINGNTSYGGGAIATDLKLVNQSTNKGVRVSGTSGGDTLVMSFDVNGTGTFVEGYNFRSADVGFYPSDDATKNVGRASNRFNIGFFAGGTQSTSDATLKDPIRDFNDAELNVAVKASESLGFWTWLDDENKRLHAGTTVQAILKILSDEDLDWRNYGFIGFDEWEDEYVAEMEDNGDGLMIETGNMVLSKAAGSVWQLRDQEFDRFVMRGLSERLARLESKNQ